MDSGKKTNRYYSNIALDVKLKGVDKAVGIMQLEGNESFSGISINVGTT